jgi:hypothetical protein
LKKAQASDSEAVAFVKSILPEHLHQFAHLIPHMVNSHVSWLDSERKQYALAVGLVAFDKAVKKRCEESTDSEFGAYVKECVKWAIQNEFATEIAERKYCATENQQPMASAVCLDQDELDYAEWESSRHDRYESYYPDDYDEQYDDWEGQWEDDDELWQSRFLTVSSEIAPGYLQPGDSLYRPWLDGPDEYTSLALSLLGPADEGDALDLLPERERELLRRYEDGETVSVIANSLQVSKPRISQLLKQATDRRDKYKARLALGERFADLLAESHKTNETSAKKQASSASAKAISTHTRPPSGPTP